VNARRTRLGPVASIAAAILVVTGAAAVLRTTDTLSRDHAHAAVRPATVAVAEPAPAVEPVVTVARPHHRRLALPARLRPGTVTLPVLMYHRVDRPTAGMPAMTRRLTVAPADFAAEMSWLAGHGYHAITEREAYEAVVRGRPLRHRAVLITFDDGYRDVFRYAVPVLQRFRMPATAFVITNRTSDRRGGTWLSWGELREMERLGLDIGSHTVSHVDLTALPRAAAEAELVRSRLALERHLGHPVQWFAYPFGGVSPAVAALTRRAGYVLAVTTRPGRAQDRRRPLELHRLEVLDTTGVAGVAALVGG
jgi:peptidoglycan/xylan/chitin deacetylase (PgdA/CDA1 family)